MMIDTHSHIYDQAFDEDRTAVIARAKGAGIEHIVLPAIDSSYTDRQFSLVASDPIFFLPAVGLHPTSVNDNPLWRQELEMVERQLKSPICGRVCAIGEVGLDLYWSREWQEQQMEAFEFQVELALANDLPLIIHTRDAWGPMCDLLERYKGRGLRGVMHAYAGSADDYRRLRACGDIAFGIGGVVTYKKSSIAAQLSGMSLDELVLETDAPYLTPTPHRGERNEPSYTIYICAKVAELLSVSEQQVAERTTANAKRIFGI